jgi:hypothetical protein
MSLEWKRNINPYRTGPYALLQIGPHATSPKLKAAGKNLRKLIERREMTVDGILLTEHLINQAVNNLMKPEYRAVELVFVHPYHPTEKHMRSPEVDSLLEAVSLPQPNASLSLVHPAAVFYFLPPPGPEILPMPPLEQLELVKAGSTEDLAHDVVFDD